MLALKERVVRLASANGKEGEHVGAVYKGVWKWKKTKISLKGGYQPHQGGQKRVASLDSGLVLWYVLAIEAKKMPKIERVQLHFQVGRHPLDTRVRHHLCPHTKITMVLPQSPILSPRILRRRIVLPLHCRKNRLELTQYSQCGEAHGQNMVMHRVHIESFSVWHDRCANSSIWCYISRTYHRTSPVPRVDKPHPATITGTRLAVAGRARKDVAQVIWDCSTVTDWYSRQNFQDTLVPVVQVGSFTIWEPIESKF